MRLAVTEERPGTIILHLAGSQIRSILCYEHTKLPPDYFNTHCTVSLTN